MRRRWKDEGVGIWMEGSVEDWSQVRIFSCVPCVSVQEVERANVSSEYQ
jgi:hypothetical protein